jgi:hypothetical protein
MELVWQAQRRRTLVDWPQAVDDRLEILVRAATAAGENVSRAQLLAALVAAADPTPDTLAELLRNYRQMHLADFAAHHDREDLPTVRHPGPRRTET